MKSVASSGTLNHDVILEDDVPRDSWILLLQLVDSCHCVSSCTVFAWLIRPSVCPAIRVYFACVMDSRAGPKAAMPAIGANEPIRELRAKTVFTSTRSITLYSFLASIAAWS